MQTYEMVAAYNTIAAHSRKSCQDGRYRIVAGIDVRSVAVTPYLTIIKYTIRIAVTFDQYPSIFATVTYT